jgi:DNA-binding response OmpR family regulator
LAAPTEPLILVVDDEPALLSSIALLLERAGYSAMTARDGKQALELLEANPVELVLLDLNLGNPLLDGLAVCREIRSRPDYTPVIMLTVRDSSADKVIGLEVGADDYITKPYDEHELLARIKATLRTVSIGHRQLRANNMRIDSHLQIDASRRRVYRDGVEIALAPRELDLLLYLVSNAGRPFGRTMLLDQVWGWDFAGDTRTVDKHIAELRRKLEDDPANPQYILTVRGLGYTFRDW